MDKRIKQKFIVSYSGGLGSFFAAKRLVEQHGKDKVAAVFADTKTEDEDLYRFLDESIAYLGIELFTIEDGRDVWQVFEDVRFLGNSRIDPCSRILKRDLIRKWQEQNLDNDYHVIALGIDWLEIHRFERVKARALQEKKVWTYCAPLCEKPFINKQQRQQTLQEIQIEEPRLYKHGFPHNNCGGFCVKAGQAQFARLLEVFPERYKYHEQKEQDLQKLLNKPVTILTRVTKGKKRPLSLRQFREELQQQAFLFDKHDWGGCGCAIDESKEEDDEQED